MIKWIGFCLADLVLLLTITFFVNVLGVVIGILAVAVIRKHYRI
jgi:hypothetical protein